MQLIIDLPNRQQTLAFHRQRWVEVCADPRWSDIAERIETDAQGSLVMSPPPSLEHSSRQARISRILHQERGDRSRTGCPLITSGGTKAIDVAWCSNERYEAPRTGPALEVSPEICVEVESPSNTSSEMRNKRALYFKAGAIDCWHCDLQGRMTYYLDQDPDTPHAESKLCPSFPKQIVD